MWLGAKIFVILCAFSSLVNVSCNGYYYYFGGQRHRHHHEGCWNNYNMCFRRGPPVCQKWCIVYVQVGFCQEARYECCSYREKPGYCPSVQPVCPWPLSYFNTQSYECHHDYNCPGGYKCCQDSCFTHKICKPCTSIPPKPVSPKPCCTTRDTEETTTKTVTKNPFTTAPNPKTVTAEATTSTVAIETSTPLITTTEPMETTPTTKPVETTFSTATSEETSSTLEQTTTERFKTPPLTETMTEETIMISEVEETTEKGTTEIQNPGTTTLASRPGIPSTTVPAGTTIDDIEGSGSGSGSGSGDGVGSGDQEIPEPEAARLVFDGFIDDEDFKSFEGSSLKCYTCSSPFEGYCDDIDDPSNTRPVPVEQCSGPNPWCYHFVHNTELVPGYPTVVQRGCNLGQTCDSTPSPEPVQRFCVTCNLNFCNNATLYHKKVGNSDNSSSCPSLSVYCLFSILVLSLLYNKI